MNQSIHNIDLLQWIMGPVESVYALTETRMRNIEAEDNAVVAIRFQGGALGLVESSVTIYPKNLEETLNIFGATGTAIIGGVAVNRIETWRFADGQDDEAEIIGGAVADPQSVYGNGHTLLIADFADAIRAGREPAIPGEEGRRALEIVLAAYKSSRTKARVALPLCEEQEDAR
jgi:predicted dehydrogenase